MSLQKKKGTEISAVDFYNWIAKDYDQKLNQSKDDKIRTDFRNYIMSLDLSSPTILDYGGGTGLDIEGLLPSSKAYWFYEPAKDMAIIAKQKYEYHNNIIFIDYNVEFDDISTRSNFPKFDLIILNYGVINYLDDLEKSFALFNSLLNDTGVLIVNRLYVPIKFAYWKTLLKLAIPILKGKGPLLASKQNNLIHTSRIYSLLSIKKHASKYFNISNKLNLGKDSDFQLIHFDKL